MTKNEFIEKFVMHPTAEMYLSELCCFQEVEYSYIYEGKLIKEGKELNGSLRGNGITNVILNYNFTLGHNYTDTTDRSTLIDFDEIVADINNPMREPEADWYEIYLMTPIVGEHRVLPSKLKDRQFLPEERKKNTDDIIIYDNNCKFIADRNRYGKTENFRKKQDDKRRGAKQLDNRSARRKRIEILEMPGIKIAWPISTKRNRCTLHNFSSVYIKCGYTDWNFDKGDPDKNEANDKRYFFDRKFNFYSKRNYRTQTIDYYNIETYDENGTKHKEIILENDLTELLIELMTNSFSHPL